MMRAQLRRFLDGNLAVLADVVIILLEDDAVKNWISDDLGFLKANILGKK